MKNRGITLVTLAVTIIVIIILAGVSLNLTLGKNGIVSMAKKAKENTELAKVEEETTLNELYKRMTETNETLESGNDTEITNLTELIAEVENLKAEITKLKEATKQIDEIYPIGSIYMTTEIATAEAMAEKFGGIWEAYAEGRTIVGVGTSDETFEIGQTGGESNHILTVKEMPRHDHQSVSGAHSTTVYTDADGYTENAKGYWLDSISISTQYSSNTGYAGETQAHNNMQPYMVTYMWKRIS